MSCMSYAEQPSKLVIIMLPWKPLEKTTSFDFGLDGVKRDFLSTDITDQLFLRLAIFQEMNSAKLTGQKITIILHHQKEKQIKSENATRPTYVPPSSASLALLEYSDKSRRTTHIAHTV